MTGTTTPRVIVGERGCPGTVDYVRLVVDRDEHAVRYVWTPEGGSR